MHQFKKVRKPCGLNRSYESLVLRSSIQQHFGVIIRVTSSYAKIQFKHIELHMHFIKNLINDHVLEVLYCPTKDKVANIFMKTLTEVKFTKPQLMVSVQEVVIKGG